MLLLLPLLLAAEPAEPADRQAWFAAGVESSKGLWDRISTLHPELGSRDIFSYALALCEAGLYPERVARCLQVAARMQDRDKESRGYGNFHWRWREGAVLDYNAVDFCMQDATLLWLRHRDRLATPDRDALRAVLDLAAEGCLRHQVGSAYTNICLMNAADLVFLGACLDRPEVTDEGVKRLTDFATYTWEVGIHEYNSPTYMGVDLDSLVLLSGLSPDPRAKELADILLDVFWSELAATWYEPARKLGGAHSRDYDYLHGLGYLDGHLRAAGWLTADDTPTYAKVALLAPWTPAPRYRDVNRTYPRLVREKWGSARAEARTQLVLQDVCLSSSSAPYRDMDVPLTVDFPGDRKSVRCYFIPDGRHDPYGKYFIPVGPHEKTLHLWPCWAAAQRGGDALGLCLYRRDDIPASSATLESHFVMPRDADGYWLGERKLELADGEPFALELPPGQAVFVRKSTAAVGVRVPWSRGLDGQPAKAAFVHDGNPYGAVRLTVAHHSYWGLKDSQAVPGAAFWVRVAGGIRDDAAFDAFRRAFEQATAKVEDRPEQLTLTAAGVEGSVVVGVNPPWRGPYLLDPAPAKGVLEVNGEELGRPILERLAAVRAYRADLKELPGMRLSGDAGTYLEAESGQVVKDMEVAADPAASGGRFVWTPGVVGEAGKRAGRLSWKLSVARAGTYYLWGRIKAPTPSDDSFLVRLFSELAEPLPPSDWHCGTHEQWEWTPLKLGTDALATPLRLPPGELTLEFRTREDGTMLDQVYLTPSPEDQPR
ncbi:MAG: hypothetical protein HYU66_19295 [Armatimonadetes bacterium]|nr:hypothetical protein [Armatimonadota bacterium]